MAATTALREALNGGISSGNLVDTKILLYSHRDSSGRICRPKALYTNSHILKIVPHFNDLLFGKFEESKPKDFAKEEIDEEGSPDDYEYLSDSDLEDDEDEKVASFRRVAKRKAHPFDPFGVPGELDKKILCEEHDERLEKGKVIKILDVAFVTFQAFLMYLYTDVIEFAPFGSEENRRSRSGEFISPSNDKVPRPSPKSIYRFADKYEVPALKALALDHIRGEVGKCDIVEESFSRFASRYGDVRDLYTAQLAFAWTEDSTAEVTRAGVETKIDDFVEGELNYMTEILSTLWEIVNKDGDIKAPLSTPPATVQAPSTAQWASMKIALIKSIREGVFFDRKYWARHSKTAGDAFKPVHFSNIIMGDKVQELNSLVKYIKGPNVPINDLEGDENIDSDCEDGYLAAASDAKLKVEQDEEESRAVLTTGSFSAWKSLFFYRCTDDILFAPLASQGDVPRLNHIREKTVATTPPPCSPKSIYVIASLLGIEPLRDSAFADIKSKVTVNNVVDELFSWVTAGHEKIKEMQCELLVSSFKDPKTVERVKDTIERISHGSSSHCAGALKLGFRTAFDLKKKKMSVQLRCSYYNCGWNRNPVSYSAVGSNIYCPNCGRGCYLQCVGCGNNRTGQYTSCQSCGKRFI